MQTEFYFPEIKRTQRTFGKLKPWALGLFFSAQKAGVIFLVEF